MGGIMSYTIIYELVSPLAWPLGLTRSLTFSVGDADGVYTPALTSPVNI